MRYPTRSNRLATALAATMLAACALPCAAAQPSQPSQPAHVPRTKHERPAGYLPPGALDIVGILPPAPMKGGPRYEADRQIFRETRALKGSARWAMAIGDANLDPAALLDHFACSVNMQLTPAQVPRLLHIVRRASCDAGRATGAAKHHFRRLRPFWIDNGPTCRPRSLLGKSFDYPSGHATVGWMWAMILAQAEPDRASEILERGRSIGQSRIVCGVHNASAVIAGRMTATAVMTAVMATPAYQHDLAAARIELSALRRTAPRPNPEQCAIESKLVAEGYGPPSGR
jgi:acid phosphatase (class A)